MHAATSTAHRRDVAHRSVRAQVKAAIRAVPDTVLINAREVAMRRPELQSRRRGHRARAFKNGRRAHVRHPDGDDAR